MAESIDIRLAGETLRLYALRAMYWPARDRLFVADVHLGKDDAFRAAGIALPEGGAGDDLRRLSHLVQLSGATSLWILGDLLHGGGPDTAWRPAWHAFLARHPGLNVLLIGGNHDHAATQACLGIELGPHRIEDQPFEFAHAPYEAGAHNPLFRICGHIHPVTRIPGFRGRFPTFAVMNQQLILPAFSAFTGGWLVDTAEARYGCIAPHVLTLGQAEPSAS